MSEPGPTEVAVAGVGFPAVIVVGGVVGPARVEQWSGKTESPASLTILYEAENIRVTTYPFRWSEDECAGLLAEEVGGWVENCYGWDWWAEQPEAFDFDGLEIASTTFVKTEKGYLETSMYEALPEDEEERQGLARREAARNAKHSIVPLSLGDGCVDAKVVGESELWSAGFEMPLGGVPLSVHMSGGSVPVDTLKLELADDLPARLGQTQLDPFSR